MERGVLFDGGAMEGDNRSKTAQPLVEAEEQVALPR